jgi:hypothetical protein
VARCSGLIVGVLAVTVAACAACAADDDAGTGGDAATATAAAPATAGPRLGPLTPTDPDRITDEQRAAIRALAAAASPAPPDASTHDHGHQESGPATTVVLSAADQASFEAQWAAAAAASAAVDTAAEREAAGYVRSAVQGAGVGVHWVDWTRIDAPFDAAHPAMLLVDERDGRDDLVGFSYWLRSDGPPAAFAGGNDVWHRHTNLCIVNGWVDREEVTSAEDCAGDLLAGSDLWMLHAWVVPGRENRWGGFAVRHPELCPAATAAPDIARCSSG